MRNYIIAAIAFFLVAFVGVSMVGGEAAIAQGEVPNPAYVAWGPWVFLAGLAGFITTIERAVSRYGW
jgi:predicted tellurium resistance membrane protein TerC